MGLLDPASVHELLSGQRRGIPASSLRAVLWAAQLPYWLVVRHRNRQYDRGRRPVHSAGFPVISVGNLTTGGTGKTPMVAWLARWFRQHRVRVVVISRGYKAQSGAQNDEALELEQQLPDVPHLQDADRVAAAQLAVEEFESQLILLDDAFQHRRIRRDLDLVLLDAVEPFGYGHLLPRGLLREPLCGLARADLVVLSRADAATPAQRDSIRQQVHRHAPQVAWVEVSHRPRRFSSASGATLELEKLRGTPLAAFCGIGNPAGFQHTLAQCGLQPRAFRAFPDHHAYQRSDIVQLAQWGRDHQVQALICTGKDLVKIGIDHLERIPLWALTVELSVDHGLAALEAALHRVLHKVQS
jgi:tetraacyldisaccharide 4'-kinase